MGASLKVTSAEPKSCTRVGRSYVVHTIASVANSTTTAVKVVKAGWYASGRSSTRKFKAKVAPMSVGGLTRATVRARTKNTYRVHVRTTVPCKTRSAKVCVNLTTRKGKSRHATGARCSAFIVRGKAVVPVGTIGLLGLTLLLGGGLAVAQVRSRRRTRGADVRTLT